MSNAYLHRTPMRDMAAVVFNRRCLDVGGDFTRLGELIQRYPRVCLYHDCVGLKLPSHLNFWSTTICKLEPLLRFDDSNGTAGFATVVSNDWGSQWTDAKKVEVENGTPTE